MIGRNMSNVNAAGNYPRPVPGGYVMEINAVSNNPQKEQLEICLEFTDGNLKGYCANIKDRFNFWPARCTVHASKLCVPRTDILGKLLLVKTEYSDGVVR